jgi:hypothetical protein
VIGVNAASLLFSTLGRPTDFYCVSDRRFLEHSDTLDLARQACGSVRVFAGYCHGFLPDADIHYLRIIGGDGISSDLVRGVYHDCSVLLFAAQLALWLGSTNMLLHGCELDYSRGRFYAEHSARPHDANTYPRVLANARRLAEHLRQRGGSLTVVGPSRLVGDFGERPVSGIERNSVADLERILIAENAGRGDCRQIASRPHV